MNCADIKEKTEVLSKENKGVLILSDVLSGVVSSLPLLGWAVSPPVQLGKYENYYNTLKGRETSWKNLYSKFDRQFESSFLFELYMAVVSVFLLIVPCLCVSIVFGLIRAIVSAISWRAAYQSAWFLSTLTFFAVLFVIIAALAVIGGLEDIGLELLLSDPEMKGNDAFDKTMEIGKKNWQLFVSLFFKFFGGLLLGIITCGIYLIKVIPHMNLSFAMLADELISGNISQEEEKRKAEADGNTAGTFAGGAQGNTAGTFSGGAWGNASGTVPGGAQGNTVFCPQCGAENEAGAMFCEKCGARLSR